MTEVDLPAYFARIGYKGTPRPDLGTLRALQFAHVTSVPFENLDVQMGMRPSLRVDDIEDKIVRRRRGGYCFEQNTLFQQVLLQIGFEVEPFLGQVRIARRDNPHTHMLLHVRIDGVSYIGDVDFGNSAPLRSLRLSARPQQAFGLTHRFAHEGRRRVLQFRRHGGWFDLYSFLPYPCNASEFEMGNHYTATHEASGFVRALVVQLLAPEERYVLTNLTYQVWRGDDVAEERAISRDELAALLRERFGLDVAERATFRALS